MPTSQLPTGVLLYFFYGLAFIFLGLAIAVKDMSESKLRLADSLPSLAIFGFSHGLHEWLECYLRLGYGNASLLLPIHYLKLLTLVVSFLFLNHFAISLMRSQPKIRWQWLRVLIPLLLVFLGTYLVLSWENLDLQTIKQADIFARLTIGNLGGILAAFALIRHGRVVGVLSRSVALHLRWAGIGFALYAFLAGVIPSQARIPVLGVPVEIFRSLTAALITYFLVKAMNVFNVETRKNLEQQILHLAQAEKLAAVGKLAAGIAHEINNPLTNVSLNVELLKNELRGGATSEAGLEKRFAVIERNIGRASRIAQELLHFSRQKEDAPVPVDLNELIKGTLVLLGKRRQQYEITTELQPLPPVRANSVKVEEVLLNLLLNAMEASEPGRTIELRSRRRGDEVVVEVIDHGCGIAPEILPRVLEPFFTTKEVGQGTGLGLSICHSIMEMHGGTIELTETAGGGTTASLIFPTVDAEGEGHD
jgi:signal transduction histidine kinase